MPRSTLIMDRIKRAAVQFADKLTKTGLECMLREATEDTEWGAPNTLLYNIADRSNNAVDSAFILQFVVETLKAKDREWHRIFKTLSLMEVLLKHGSLNCVMGLRENSYRVRGLQDFSYNDKGIERGSGIREKARALSVMLSDQGYLDDERQKARGHRDKFLGISSDSYSMGVVRPTPGQYESGSAAYESPTIPQARTESNSMFEGTSATRQRPQPVATPSLFTGLTVAKAKDPVAAPDLFSRDLFEKKPKPVDLIPTERPSAARPEVDLFQVSAVRAEVRAEVDLSQGRSLAPKTEVDLFQVRPPAPRTEANLFQGLQPKATMPPGSIQHSAKSEPSFLEPSPPKVASTLPLFTSAPKSTPQFPASTQKPLPSFSASKAPSGLPSATAPQSKPLVQSSSGAAKASLPLFTSPTTAPTPPTFPTPTQGFPSAAHSAPQAFPSTTHPSAPSFPTPQAYHGEHSSSLEGLQFNLPSMPPSGPQHPPYYGHGPAEQLPHHHPPSYSSHYPVHSSHAPQSKVLHNMEGYSGPTLEQIKVSPSILQRPAKQPAQPATTTLTPAELEARLTSLDDFQVERKNVQSFY
jgi:epsin